MCPSLSRVLYSCAKMASEKMVAIPKKAASHIQKIAPGPPIAMAVATPARFPVPTCAAIAVAKDWKEVIPCFPAFSPLKEILPKTCFMARPNCRICTKCNLKVKNIPVPTKIGMRHHGPHSIELILDTI